MFTRHSQAVSYVGLEGDQLSFVLAKAQPAVPLDEPSTRIESASGLQAEGNNEVASSVCWSCIWQLSVAAWSDQTVAPRRYV
jgi:hypothetical protein